MRLAIPLVSLLFALVSAACSGHGTAPPEPARPAAPPAHESTSPATSEPTPAAPVPVTFSTDDGVTIAGTLHPGATPDAPAVVLVHRLASTRAEWDPLVAQLSQRPALTVLAIDMRGHGESTHAADGRTLDFNSFSADEWRATAKDVRAAVAWLSSPSAPVHPRKIAAVGASIGSSAVIAAAADEPGIVAVVALSPGRAYHGFDAITPATHLGDRPLFALAAREETDAADMAGTLAHIVPRGTSLLVDGSAHGVAMFASSPQTIERVDDFLRTALN